MSEGPSYRELFQDIMHCRQADPMAFRRKYGRNLRIVGGIDKRALAKGRAAIDAELARRPRS